MAPLFLLIHLLLASPFAAVTAHQTTLADLALAKVLADAEPIFGAANATHVWHGGPGDWMASLPDNTPLTQINIPGTHDSATWNFSDATRASIAQNTDPAHGVAPAVVYRCQRASLLASLRAGVRFLDLRYALDPARARLVFWHGPALLSAVATLEDVLFALYAWLDAHPSETVLVSMQYEGGTQAGAGNDAAVQAELQRILTGPAARRYFVQARDALGTLGAARGKAVLLRRFDVDKLPAGAEAALPGVHLSPALWPDNGKDFVVEYNAARNLTAYVEDYYKPNDLGDGASVAAHVAAKFNATAAHLAKAAGGTAPDSLFVTFASGEHNDNVPAVWPETMAVGNGTATPLGGVNQQLVPFLRTLKGKRVGVVVVDFWDTPEDLVQTILSL